MGSQPHDKWTKIYFWVGLFVALFALGLPLIGVTINVWLGGALLAGAFIAIVRAFWIWERPLRLHVHVRLATIVLAGLVYFGLVGMQMIQRYKLKEIVKSDGFTMLIPINTSNPGFPIALDENPDDPHWKFYRSLWSFVQQG